MVQHLLSESKKAQQVRVRYTSRLLPVTYTCFASMDAMAELAEKMVEQEFPGGEGDDKRGLLTQYSPRISLACLWYMEDGEAGVSGR